MFSKALFKQSCKANGLMWLIITFAVCFMLSCVMLISGSGNIAQVKNAVEDTIITGEIDAQMEKRAVNYYALSNDGLEKFDGYYVQNYPTISTSLSTYDSNVTTWISNEPKSSDYSSQEEYLNALQTWKAQFPTPSLLLEQLYAKNFSNWQSLMPQRANFESDELYSTALSVWKGKCPIGKLGFAGADYLYSVLELKGYVQTNAQKINSTYNAESDESQEMVGVVFNSLNPNLDENLTKLYTANNETLPDDYDIQSLLTHMASGDVAEYLSSDERISYIQNRSKLSSSIFLAGNMTSEKNIEKMLTALSSYGVTETKYQSFGYTYTSINHSAMTTIISYQSRYDYELGLINEKYITAEQRSSDEYKNEVLKMNSNLTSELTDSLLSSLPASVSSALEEVGQMDLYSLIVGSIFYKMAGLLLPIIYMIMASNNLIAGQVDTGSMAYVLSTSTKRKQVTFTQAVYLAGSLLAMFCCTTLTSIICLAILNNPELQLTYGKLILLNLGAFVTLFAMSGICFLASCWFDRSKHSMAIGGGISMFFLVATMLGLFGSKVIPSVVRLDALNNFNFVSIISLFDVISIIDGNTNFIWKFAILFAIGLLGYIIGSIRFEKKDLPL